MKPETKVKALMLSIQADFILTVFIVQKQYNQQWTWPSPTAATLEYWLPNWQYQILLIGALLWLTAAMVWMCKTIIIHYKRERGDEP